MPIFPVLRTGAAAQYPLRRTLTFASQAVPFLDGSRQSYRLSVGLRRWTLTLDRLDETELAALMAFAEEVGTDTFPFTDPATGEIVPACVLTNAQLEAVLLDELNGQTTLEIEEVK